MKKLYFVMAVVIIVSILTSVGLENIGFHRIQMEDGRLYGKMGGNSKDVVVLFVAGSGPTDMDGNTPLAQGRNDSFRELAKRLNDEGIATFRYDKRTAGKSAETFDLEDMNDFKWFVEDCAATIEYLKELGYKEIVVLGHSQGSLVGMLAAAQEPVAGFISLAGAGFPVDRVLERQLLQQISEDSEEIRIIRSLREGRIDESVKDDHLFNVQSQEFLLTWMKHDPAEVIGGLEIPMLLLQGSADLQVDKADFAALKAAAKDAETLLIENMNHVLKEVENEEENIASYSDPAYRVHEDLVGAVVDFVHKLQEQ